MMTATRDEHRCRQLGYMQLPAQGRLGLVSPRIGSFLNLSLHLQAATMSVWMSELGITTFYLDSSANRNA